MSSATAKLHIVQNGKALGDIVLRFFSDVAPGHTKNFVDLSRSGFYDGSHFHRVIPGFMIQGGDPNSKLPDRSKHGMGNHSGPDGKARLLKAEFNPRPHRRGTLSMARANDPNSASCQFFICVADSNFLDGKYTAFGEVISGMEVADAIVATPRDRSDNPLTDVVIEKIEIIDDAK